MLAVSTTTTMLLTRLLLLVVVMVVAASGMVVDGGGGRKGRKERAGDEEYHKRDKLYGRKTKTFANAEDAEFWRNDAQDELQQQLSIVPQVNQAKNVILFLGDGMSLPTVTAARIMKGQRSGLWEREKLSWETFPFSGLSKTYTTDSQVADSAASATAYLCGVKTERGTIGVDVNVPRGNCVAQLNSTNHVDSIAKWFQTSGRSSGVITKTRITHATPAAIYAHTAERGWEDDHEVSSDGEDPNLCNDIAQQLLQDTGSQLKVIMGGGRRHLLPNTEVDIEEGSYGYRQDGRNIVQEWLDQKAGQGATASYVWNKDDLLAVDTANTDYLMGLYDYSHMEYLVEQDETLMDPGLPEMTRVALEMLQKDSDGYFLLVEGGLIDLGHHGNRGIKAVTETVEMDEAVQMALSMTDPADTLIVVTADHAHSVTINGYPDRHTDILDIAYTSDTDALPYTTLLYGNGPGYQDQVNGLRPDISGDDLYDVDYRQAAAVPKVSAAHAGDDVGIWALGPHSHLFTGVHEQSYIPHAMAYAACVGDGLTFCTP